MTDHCLPDNLDNWPYDPYAVLGVARNVNERGLKRAYAQLIRRYKPEHHPAKFARVREAYESVQRDLQFQAQFEISQVDKEADALEGDDDPSVIPEPHSVELPSRMSDSLEPVNSEDEPKFDGRSSLQRQTAAAWQFVIDDEPAAGYRELLNLLDTHPSNDEICVRLYWILRISPGINPELTPASWLCVALRQNHLSGRAWNLFKWELEHDDLLGVSDDCSKLLAVAAPVQRVCEIAMCRWRAAASGNRWSLILADLEDLRVRTLDDYSVIWAQLLFRALDFACWSASTMPAAEELMLYCDRELGELTELRFELGAEFERLDHMKQVSQALMKCGPDEFPADLIEIIRDYFTVSMVALRPRLLRFLESWTIAPRTTLDQMDKLAQQHEMVVMQLAEIIGGMESGANHDRDAARAHRIEILFIDLLTSEKRNTAFHLIVFDFCVLWQISVNELIAMIANSDNDLMSNRLIQRFMNDLAFRTVLDGIIAFWASTSWVEEC